MNAKRSDRRRARRIEVAGRARGKIKQIIEASLINISTVGALVEHAHSIVIDQLYQVTFHLGEMDVTFQARAVRSFVSGSQELPGGKARLIYRTGLEFLDASHEDVDFIIRAIQGGSEGTSSLSLFLVALNRGQEGWPWSSRAV